MRRALLLGSAALAIAVTALPSSAAGERTVTKSYKLATTSTGPGLNVQIGGFVVDGDYYGMATAAAPAGDRHVAVTIADDNVGVVAATIQEISGGTGHAVGVICGKSTFPLRLPYSHGTVIVRPAYGACGMTPSTPTTGTISFRFTR